MDDNYVYYNNYNRIIIMTTISITNDVKKELLKLAAGLQLKYGRRLDFNDTIRYLLNRSKKKPELLEEACRSIPEFKEVYGTLRDERRKDEERAKRKFSI
ncbi:MAG: hypothetical protein ACP5IZ_11685 [Thermoprotei archaeon]